MKLNVDLSQWHIDKFRVILKFKNQSHYNSVFFRSGNEIMGALSEFARQTISRENRNGIVYSYGRASAPNEPISIRTGETKRRVYKKVSLGARQYILGSNAPYSKFPEDGTPNGKIKPRNTFKDILFNNKAVILRKLSHDLIYEDYYFSRNANTNN